MCLLIIWSSLVIFFCTNVCCKVVYKWEKAKIIPEVKAMKWRATSLALTKEKVFFTLVDIDKQSIGNGLVGSFSKDSLTPREVTIFPFPHFYKLKDPFRGQVTTPISVRVDHCARLWLLDAAVQNISGIQTKSTPGIHVINTSNNHIVRSFKIPTGQWTSSSFFVNFVIDSNLTDKKCEESFGYFADFNRFRLMTYDFRKDKSFLKSHPFFSPDPLLYTPNEILYNVRHQDMNGIFGLAMVKNPSYNMTDNLYFHSLAGIHKFKVNTKILKSDGNINYKDVKILNGKDGNTQTGASVFHSETNTIFYAEINTKKIGVLPLKGGKKNFYHRFDFNLKRGFVVDLSIISAELWALVDDNSEITIHKFFIKDIIEKIFCSDKGLFESQSCSGAYLTASSSCFFIIIFSWFRYFKNYP